MDLRDTGNFGWTNKERRGQPAILDLEAEVVTRNTPRIASADSVAVRVRNEIEGRTAVFTLDGSPAEADGWHPATAAEIGVLKAAGVMVSGWAADPAPLVAAGLVAAD